MRKELPIATAPKDGRKITVVWTDDDDQRNEFDRAVSNTCPTAGRGRSMG